MAEAVIQQDVDIQSPSAPQNTSVAGSQAEATRMQSSTGVQQATGNVLTAESPDVKAEMAKNPGLTIDAAIGNVAMRQGKQGTQDDAYLSQLKDLEAKQEMSKVDEIKKTTTTPQTTAEIEAENPYAQELRQVNDQSVLEMQNYLNKLDEFGQNLSERSKAEIENIKKTFALRKDAQEKQNDAIMGLMQRAGAVSGRQRYAPEIQMQLISEEESVAISRLAALDVQEQQLILEAEKAASQEEFAALQMKMQGILQIQKIKSETVTQLYNIAKKEEEMAITKAREKREEAMFGLEFEGAKSNLATQKRTQALDQISLISQGGMEADELDTNTIAKLATDLDLPETAIGGLFENIKAANLAAAEKANIDTDIEITKVLQDIPAGTEVAIGNKIYTGLKEVTKDISTYSVKDAGGNETTYFYDKKNGEVIDSIQTIFAPEQIDYTGSLSNAELQASPDYNLAKQVFNGTFSPSSIADKDQKQAVMEIVSAMATKARGNYDKTGNLMYYLQSTATSDNYPTATEREDLAAKTGVITDLKKLQDSFSNLENFGPILGRIRSANDYDDAAKEINARLQGITPGIARGVFGEVGVLTDKDIERYKATLPNMATDKDQVDTLMKIITEKVEGQIANTLESAARSNINVSQFAEKYQETQTEISKMLGKQPPKVLAGSFNDVSVNDLDLIEYIYNKYPTATEDDLMDVFNDLDDNEKKQMLSGIYGTRPLGFKQVGGDTNKASIKNKVSSTIPQGTRYTDPKDGECGYWSRKIVDYPSGTGDYLQDKKNFVAREGLSADMWRKQGVRAGDVIFTDDSKTYGHVAVVNSVNPDGTITLSESNYKGKYLVTHDRTIPITSPKIFGAVRGRLKV